LPNGGRYFLSRAAHGLAYQVSREDALSRHLRRADRILAKLGGIASGEVVGIRRP
jgi:hypothetical protein